MYDIIDHDWSRCHISDRTVTYNDVVYQANPPNQQIKNAAKSYLGYDGILSGTELDKTQKNRKKFDHWQISNCRIIDNFIAAGTEEKR